MKAFEKPLAVVNIKALHRDKDINIFWQYPATEKKMIKGCQILRSDGTDSDFKELAFLKTDEQAYVDKDFLFNNEYYYKIRCLSQKGIYSDDSSFIKVLTLSPPQKVRNLSYTIMNDSIKIQWERVGNIKYNVYKTYQKGNYSLYPINSSPIKDNFYIDKIDTTKIVYYKVSAHLDTDVRNEGPLSEELEIDPADFVPSAPSGLIYAPLEKKVYLLWKENPETWVKGYRVYKKKALDKEFSLIGEVISPIFTDVEPLELNTIYYITALGPKKESQPSQKLILKTIHLD